MKKLTIEIMQQIAIDKGGKCLSKKYISTRHLLEWECAKGHRWNAKPYSITNGPWCQTCFPRTSVKPNSKKLTDVASSKLLSEWAYDLNDTTPDQFTSQSKRKVYWRCSSAHVWKTTIQARAIRGDGCPDCYELNRGSIVRTSKLKKAGTSFAIKFPHLLSEWDYDKNDIDPNEIAPYSNYKVFWRCKHNHSWDATIDNRTLNDSGCPFCSNQTSKIEIFILCELRSIFKEVIWRRKFEGVEADIFLSTEQIAIEVDGEYWHRNKIDKDKEKSEFFDKLGIKLIRVRSSELPSIEGLKVLHPRGKDNFAIVIELFEILAVETENLSVKKYLLDKVRRGEEEYKEITSRLPAPPEEKSLAFLYPNLVKEWDYQKNAPLTPDLFSAGSELKAWWICSKKHSWYATIKNRTNRESGCPHCMEDRYDEKRRLSIKKIHLYAKDRGGSCIPTNYVNTSSKLQWECTKGHKWSATSSIVKNNTWCPVCSRSSTMVKKK